MAIDIVPELLDQVETAFAKGVETDKRVLKYLNRIRDGTATLDDVSMYARSLGELLSDILQDVFGKSALPGGHVYYNIANRVITPMLKEVQRLTNHSAADVQKAIDMIDGIGLKPIAAVFPDQRVNDLMNAISEDGIELAKSIERMGEPIRNISQSFFDDFVEANADHRYKAGLQTYIVRTLSGRACEWCTELAGRYLYPDEIPEAIFQRHDRCRCTVAYKSGKTVDVVHSQTKYIQRGGMTKTGLKELHAKLKRYPGGK